MTPNAGNVTIRPVEARDLPIIVEMTGILAAQHHHTAKVTADQLASELLGPTPHIHILVAEIDGLVVGYALLQPHFSPVDGARFASIDLLFVTRKHRGQGIGRRLVDAVVEMSGALGCAAVRVDAVRRNKAAQAFYRAVGFARAWPATPQFWRRTRRGSASHQFGCSSDGHTPDRRGMIGAGRKARRLFRSLAHLPTPGTPMTVSLFAPDYQDMPYWWEAAPRPAGADRAPPARADLVVVGSGYTGLSTALVTARAGRDVLVLDSEAIGWGCSTRNGGQVSTSIKPSHAELAARHGAERAFAIRKEGMTALAWIGDFIKAEDIDCDWQVVGRFHAAHNPAQYEKLAREVVNQPRGLEVEAHVVARAGQHREIGSDYYHGGVVFPAHAALDPAKYHAGLLARATAAGATVIGNCAVTAVAKNGDGFTVTTPRGAIAARNVAICSNGYTAAVTPWQRRRVIPIGSYIIATEALPLDLTDRLMPNNRMMSDTRKLVFYYRLSPDRTRVLFGGRVAYKETDPRVSAPRLHDWMSLIFPQLKETRISHSWVGFVAYTFDTLPHLGQQDGLYYSMGYCGSGVSLASYFGWRLGHKIIGGAEGRTSFDGLDFQTRPFYSGDPWFLAASIAYYKWRDKRNV